MNKMTFIFHYSTNYGRLTRVNRLKVAVNMVDPTCLLQRVRSLKVYRLFTCPCHKMCRVEAVGLSLHIVLLR